MEKDSLGLPSKDTNRWTPLVVQQLRVYAPKAVAQGTGSQKATTGHMLQPNILYASAKTRCSQIAT